MTRKRIGLRREIMYKQTEWDGGAVTVDKPNVCLMIPKEYTHLGFDCEEEHMIFCSTYGEIVIPDSVVALEDSAFDSSVVFNDVRIPDNCVVESGAFVHFHCDRLIIGKGVKLAKDAFHHCEFNEIIFEDENDVVEDAFYECFCTHDVPQNTIVERSKMIVNDWILDHHPDLIG